MLGFVQSSHLQRGKAVWSCTPMAGRIAAQRDVWLELRRHRSAIGMSDASGLGRREDGSLDARLIALPGPARPIPKGRGWGFAGSEMHGLPTRLGSTKKQSHLPLTA